MNKSRRQTRSKSTTTQPYINSTVSKIYVWRSFYLHDDSQGNTIDELPTTLFGPRNTPHSFRCCDNFHTYKNVLCFTRDNENWLRVTNMTTESFLCSMWCWEDIFSFKMMTTEINLVTFTKLCQKLTDIYQISNSSYDMIISYLHEQAITKKIFGDGR